MHFMTKGQIAPWAMSGPSIPESSLFPLSSRDLPWPVSRETSLVTPIHH